MSDNIEIKVENLSKRYPIFDSPRDRLKQMVLPRLQALTGTNNAKYYREFWALKDVAFEVKRGETVGIIGRNGSGKSTLLQIICGTLAPTSGNVKTRGRVAALLELGSGFNPEFTGRENVYMNASVLGLRKADIDARFDEIAAFADIGEFIDQPIRTYSSGMIVRLAFAVVAHVDADILIIDEALSVGDAVFTQKCMRFIRSFQENGTLLFVSHDMAAVQNLCAKALWLSKGKVHGLGESKLIAEEYLKETLQETYGNKAILKPLPASGRESSNGSGSPATDAEANLVSGALATIQITNNTEFARGWETGAGRITNVSLVRLDGLPFVALQGGEKVRVSISAETQRPMTQPILGFLWQDRLGQTLFAENTLPFTESQPQCGCSGQHFVAEFDFHLPLLPDGQYVIVSTLAEGDRYDHVQHHWLHDAIIVQVVSSKIRWGLVGIPFQRVNLKIGNE
jgi:lipopolysaccharide transport system ATP-binding protein